MLCVEFHCHTVYSKDSLMQPETLVKTCLRKGIDRVIVTDHNTIAGAQAAWDIAPDLVIVGEEIKTTKGELLAAFVSSEVPPGLTPRETVSRLKQQGAFISVSHPFDTFRSGHWDPADLLEILPEVDAIETFNARCFLPGYNRQAYAFAREHGIPGTVGSDAHAPIELGRAVLYLEDFRCADDLRACLQAGLPRLQWSPPWFHVLSRYAVLRKRWSRVPRP